MCGGDDDGRLERVQTQTHTHGMKYLLYNFSYVYIKHLRISFVRVCVCVHYMQDRHQNENVVFVLLRWRQL